MKIVICYAVMFCIMAVLLSFRLSVRRLKLLQRMRLLTLYSNLYFSAKLNYKQHKEPALFQSKKDFLCFRAAFTWLVPYIYGTKDWKDISDWDMGMLAERVIKATNKYPNSRMTEFINGSLVEIVKRSVVLLFPVRINLFMHLANNKDNKCIISDIDFTELKREVMEIALKNYKISTISQDPSMKTVMQFSNEANFIDRFSLVKFASMCLQRL